MASDLYPIGEAPPLGVVPRTMYACTARRERYGQPKDSLKTEVVRVPEIGDDDVLVYVMAAGVNYNNVWAAQGIPVDVIAARKKGGEDVEFHIGGSDASGIVYKVGKNVTYPTVGTEVVVHCGHWDGECPHVKGGGDPMYSPSFRIWGYELNWGSFAQFARVQAHQCLPRPQHLSWEASASYMLVGATAYRMLHGFQPNTVKEGDVALIWGGAGGLGSMAIQICRAAGAIPIAVVSDREKYQYCIDLGAKGCINRNDFDHWGMLPHWKDKVGYDRWLKGVRAFGKAIWDILGDRRSPNLVFEHPGETTIPTSIFNCDTGGMVVICAGTTGYNATVDLRYLWMRQKRLQGSHFANDVQAAGVNALVTEVLVDPCLSRTFEFGEIPLAHQLMFENKHPHGNMAVLVGAQTRGSGGEERRRAVSVTIPARPLVSSGPISPRVPPAQLADRTLPPPAPVVPDTTEVREILRRGVISCAPEATVEEVVALLVANRIHAVVVVVGRRPLGIVSQTDIVLARQGRPADEAKKLTADAIMTRGCITCAEHTKLYEAITLMTRNRVHRLVVVDPARNDELVGVLTMTDIIEKTLGFKE